MAALLIVFRLMQGISFGAEFAPPRPVVKAAASKYRAFWGLGRASRFRSTVARLRLGDPHQIADDGVQEHFAAWGWRILFVIGFLVAIVGIFIRRRTEDSFVFAKHKANSAVLDHPERQVWARYAADHPAHLAGERDVRRRVLPLLRSRHRLHESNRFTGSTPELIGLIAAVFMAFMVIGALLADIINRRTILRSPPSSFWSSRSRISISSTPAASVVLATIAEIVGFGFVFGFPAMGRSRPLHGKFPDSATAPRAPARPIRSRRSMAAGSFRSSPG